MIVFALAALYVCLSLAFSLAVSNFIPSVRMLSLRIPRGLEQAATGGIILFSCLSLISASAAVSTSFQIPLHQAFVQMLYGTLQGKGWLGILLCGAGWYGIDALVYSRLRRTLLLAATLGLIVFTAVTMHAATLSLGVFIAQAFHLVAVSTWLGFLFLAGWFSREDSPWRRFLAWFSPVAAACVMVIAVTGVVLMNAFSSDWLDALTLNYGQVLLVKHLLIVPLLAFAFINGILTRKRLGGTSSFDPRGWLKAESMAALAVFAVTAALSRQAPPHNLRQTLRYTPPSSWFLQIYDGVVTPNIHLTLAAAPIGFIFAASSILFLGMTFLCFHKHLHFSIGLCTALLFVLSGYLALMIAIR